MVIRPLNWSDDLLAVSRVYEKSWKHAYRGIIPQSYLDSIPAGQWAKGISGPERHSLVMLEGETIIGTASYGPARIAEMEGFGELVSIYLLPEYMGKGHGTKLLAAAEKELGALGFRSIYLWVLEENARARRFYEKSGFSCAGIYQEDTIGGSPLREVQYRKSGANIG